jgi:hypothetical protein
MSSKSKFRVKIWDNFSCVADIKESDVKRMEKKVKSIFRNKM